jgi:hypothetical protein
MRKRLAGWLTVRRLGFVLGAVGITVAVGDRIVRGDPVGRSLWEFLVSVGPELFGIAFTVIVIDWLNERAAADRAREQLIHEMGSKDNATALRAVEELRERGWLLDGSTRRADLKYANLAGAILDSADLEATYLSFANLHGADLRKANLKNAILRRADLTDALLLNVNLTGAKLLEADLRGAKCQGATLDGVDLRQANLAGARGLSDEILATAHSLSGSILPTGVAYDGRFRLPGDRDEED